MGKIKKIPWYSLAFMAFSAVWGFGNVINGFVYFNGIQAIFSWILIFALYFVPYALMVGELGSAFREAGGGVSSWIKETIGPKMAYYAGWTYWIVHMPYIAQKPTSALNALSWIVYRNGGFFTGLKPIELQIICLIVFFIAVGIAYFGINPLKRITTIAGSSMFVMSILFILMMLAAPMITGRTFQSIDWSLSNMIPKFDLKYLTSLSILIFAVGGCEKISPYVNKVENPAKGFPKGMLFLAVMVVICAILGTIALAMMADPSVYSTTEGMQKFVLTGSYESFAKVGEYYGLGNSLLIIYAICEFIGQTSALILAIDAPLRMLFDSGDAKYIPKGMLKKNKKGSYTNGLIMVVIIVGSLIILPALASDSVAQLFATMIKLNSVCMPLRYLWVFAAYIALKKAGDKFFAEYRFVKGKTLGIILGAWCFIVTAGSSIFGIYVENNIGATLINVITPIILIGLGVVLPFIAKMTNKKRT